MKTPKQEQYSVWNEATRIATTVVVQGDCYAVEYFPFEHFKAWIGAKDEKFSEFPHRLADLGEIPSDGKMPLAQAIAYELAFASR